MSENEEEVVKAYDELISQLKSCEDIIENHKIDAEKRRKKYLKKLAKLANNLENANYHRECGIICDLREEYKNGKFLSVEDVFEFLCNNPEWKRL